MNNQYQQRVNHQQIHQQQQIHGGGNRNLNGINQHQLPPPIIHHKQHLHQNIATLNQKPPPQQHGQSHGQPISSQPNSQIQSSQRLPYESKIHLNLSLLHPTN